MTKVLSDSLDPILHRRRILRYQRRLKLLQAGWRTLAIASLSSGLLWAVSLPEWVIRHPNQVSIKGNQLLSTTAIQSLLPLRLPQSLIHLQPELIIEALKSEAPLDKVTVVRQLFPAKLTILVKERAPIAVVLCDSRTVVKHSCASVRTPSKLPLQQRSTDIWLLDRYGIIMPLENYPTLQQSGQLPQLTVLGMLGPSTYRQTAKDRPSAQRSPSDTATSESETLVVNQKKRAQWPQLYGALSQSPVKVFQIDWQDETNLILKTELGIVHIGPYSAKFANQLNTLDQMRSLPKYLSTERVAYIDLKNPKNPLLQMNNSK